MVNQNLACALPRRLPTSFLSQRHLIFSLGGSPQQRKILLLVHATSIVAGRADEALRLHPSRRRSKWKCSAKRNEKSPLLSYDAGRRLYLQNGFRRAYVRATPRNGKKRSPPRPFVYYLRQTHNPGAPRRPSVFTTMQANNTSPRLVWTILQAPFMWPPHQLSFSLRSYCESGLSQTASTQARSSITVAGDG